MKADEFYRKSRECRLELRCVKAEDSDVLLCVKHGGLCQLKKCLNIHNSQGK